LGRENAFLTAKSPVILTHQENLNFTTSLLTFVSGHWISRPMVYLALEGVLSIEPGPPTAGGVERSFKEQPDEKGNDWPENQQMWGGWGEGGTSRGKGGDFMEVSTNTDGGFRRFKKGGARESPCNEREREGIYANRNLGSQKKGHASEGWFRGDVMCTTLFDGVEFLLGKGMGN